MSNRNKKYIIFTELTRLPVPEQ